MPNTILIPSDGQPITTLAELNSVIEQADAAATGAAGALPAGAYEIDLAGNIALTGALEAIDLQPGVTLEINGEGYDINGENSQRGLFVYAGAVAIDDLTIEDAKAIGGAGGSGGGGGGLFVGANVAGAVTLRVLRSRTNPRPAAPAAPRSPAMSAAAAAGWAAPGAANLAAAAGSGPAPRAAATMRTAAKGLFRARRPGDKAAARADRADRAGPAAAAVRG